MNSMRRTTSPFLLALLPALMLLASTPASAGAATDRIKQTGTLRLGYGPDTPLSTKDSAGKPAGFAIDLCNKVAEGVKSELGVPALKVDYVAVTREEGVRAVADGKVDVLCAPTVATSATRKTVSYSIPVFASGVSALVRKNASARLKDILSGRTPPTSPNWRGNADKLLRESTISVVKGSRTEEVVDAALDKRHLVANIVPVDDYMSGVTRVLEGRSNVFFGDRVVLLDAVRRGAVPAELQILDRHFTTEALAFAVPRGDEDLRLIVDNALSKFFRSDELPSLFSKYFGVTPSDDIVTMFRAASLAE